MDRVFRCAPGRSDKLNCEMPLLSSFSVNHPTLPVMAGDALALLRLMVAASWSGTVRPDAGLKGSLQLPAVGWSSSVEFYSPSVACADVFAYSEHAVLGMPDEINDVVSLSLLY